MSKKKPLSAEEQDELRYFVDAMREWLGHRPLYNKGGDKTQAQRFADTRWVNNRTGKYVYYEVV